MKKPDLLKYCKQLENINEKLQNENSKLVKMIEDNKDTIKNLGKSVKVLELKNQVLNQQEEKFRYTCAECDYESDCVHCFSDHYHDQEYAKEEDAQDSNFNCYYCDEVFPTKAAVMIHTKHSHTDKAKHCLNFLSGTCSYNDMCWFLHDEKLRESDPTFKCNYCEENFRTKMQLMNHKKQSHTDKVSKCSNENKNCKYGSEKCWFLHTEYIEQAYKIAKNVTMNGNGTGNKNDTDIKT